jgi:thiosulfate/3-mercaptopyruvate sulfurtransferase
MSNLRMILLFALFSPVGLAQPQPVFVTTDWLSGHLRDSNLVVLHVSFSRPEYRLGHIPGARFLWYDWLAVSTPDASTEMPPPAQADTVLEGLGLSERSTIILCYSGNNLTSAARVYLALSYFGLGARTSILDGGLEAWKSEKRPLSQETPVIARTELSLRANPAVIVDAEMVRATLHDPGVAIIDARDKRFFDGMGGSVARTGHILGAKSIPYSSVVDTTTRLKSRTSLEQIFADAGLSKGTRLVVYCHVGQQACVVYAVARSLGYEAAVYDGSFQDWSLRGEEYPVERIEPVKK